MGAARLATIVAVDVSGFSALAQADEAAAIAAVARLNERCAAVADKHAGRIFNTAGDAVLMEFSTVSSGIRAAEELAAHPDPPIRVGVHLGEVSMLPSGDLLGHGVNVAARIQSRARTGGVLVSEDARRALRGPLAARLVSRGVIKLDKIDESIGVYELVGDTQPIGPVDAAHRAARQARLLALGAVGLVAVLALGFLTWQFLLAPSPTRVAIFSLAAPDGDNALQSLANGVADDVSLALNAAGVRTIARAETANGTREERLRRARNLGAALALDGAAERDGEHVRINVAIARAADRTTLWSRAYDGAVSDVEALRQRAAEQTADVLSCGVSAMPRQRRALDTETLSLLLRGCAGRRDQEGLLDVRDAMTQVIARDPQIPYARAMLALSSVMASEDTPEPVRTRLLESARAEAERALREDPHIGEAYVALALLEPPNGWEGRERLLRRGLEQDERNSVVYNNYAGLLMALGRVREALTVAERGVALDPLSRSKRRHVAYLLALNERHEEARDIVDSMARVWPDDAALWRARLRLALWAGRFDEAVGLIDAPGSGARSDAARACWRLAAQILRAPAPSERSAVRVRACYDAGHLPDGDALRLLVALGDLDGAFALVGALPGGADTLSGVAEGLFAPGAAALRADPRFMPLMRDLGLLEYWRLSGRWPDFCREPRLPYRCEAEAARLT